MLPVSSVFSQLLQLFSRREFAQAVKEHQAERCAKGFTCWGQFVDMLFCQVAQLKSLREMTKPPINLQDLRRRIYQKAKLDKSHRFWGLFVHITKIETLEEAYRAAKR